MVRLSASTCTKLLQALGRLHGSLSPADLGPADSMTAAQRQAAQTQASTMLAGGAWYVYEYCMDAGHKVAPADADVVWDLQASPGTTARRCYSPDLGTMAMSTCLIWFTSLPAVSLLHANFASTSCPDTYTVAVCGGARPHACLYHTAKP